MAKTAPAAKPKTRVDEGKLSPARLEILNRRRKDPHGIPSAPIALKDPNLECRWFNTAISDNKIWQALQNGWEFVKREHVVDLTQIGGFTETAEGQITRGSRTSPEFLMAMPRDFRDEIQMAKTRANLRNIGSESRMKDEVVEAVGRERGDQAAEFMQSKVNVRVTDTREIVQRSEGPLE